LALGAFFASITGFVLFADVIGGAPFTTNHALALAALVAAIASGHYAWPALRSGQIVPAIMLAVLFIGSTGYVVVSSGARNAETAGTKSARIAETNSARARELQQLARAEGMLTEAERKLDKDCVKGKASKGTCDGIRATLAVYAAAIKGHKATLRELGPELAPGGGYAHAAKVLVAAGIPGTAASIEERLSLLMPFIVVLIAELGTIAFLHLGLGHSRVPTVADTMQTAFAAPEPPNGCPGKRRKVPTPDTPRELPANVVMLAGKRQPDIVAALQAAGGSATVSELALAMKVTKGEASRRWREAGPLVIARRQGRFVVVSLARSKGVAA
jgi:hypothetical protein